MADQEPAGLGMSLDQLIERQQRDQGYGKQQRGRRSQQHQQGGRGGRGGPRGGGSGGGGGRQQAPRYNLRHQQQQQQHAPDAYRQEQSCWQEDDGTVVFRFKRTDLVKIDPAGNITLDAGGHYNGVTLASLNDALNLIGIRVTCPGGDVHTSDWSISDGRSLTRFEDGVVLAAKGAQHAGRGRQLLTAFNSPHGAAQAAAMAASNAAATMAGIMPFTGFVPPGVPASRPPQAAPRGARGGGGSVFARLGGRPQQQQEQRFTPY